MIKKGDRFIIHISAEEADLAYALKQIIDEYFKVKNKYSKYKSAHEGHSVIREEFDELWDEVKKRVKDKTKMRIEAMQVATTAMRFMIDITGEEND